MIFIASPSAHYPSHNWPNSVALARALIRRGIAVHIIIFNSPPDAIPPDLRDRVTVVCQRASGSRQIAAGWPNVYETLACLFRALRLSRGQPQAVLHFIGGSYWTIVVAALLCRRRFVQSPYSGILAGPAAGAKALLRPLLKWLLRRAAATGRLDFTCENELVRGQIAALVGPRVRLIPYAVDDEEPPVPQAEARQRLGLPPGEKIILFFGTHRLEKDYLTPLRACLTLPVPPLALFVGKVISENDPARAAAACHYPNARFVNDFVPEDLTKYYFAAADALVLPYEAGFARGSGVLIECCRYLRPMIASATPYFSSFLQQYPCGVTYAPGDSASFALAAQPLLANPAAFHDALARARRDHSWQSAADKYIDLYEAGRR